MNAQLSSEKLSPFLYEVRLPTVIRFQRVVVKIRGQYLAPSLDAAEATLAATDLAVVRVRAAGHARRGPKLHSSNDLAVLLAQLRTLLVSGYPLPEHLRRMARDKDIESLPLRVAVMIIAADIESGVSPAEAFARHPRLIPEAVAVALSAEDPAARIAALLDRGTASHRRLGVFRRLLLYPTLLTMTFLFFGWIQQHFVLGPIQQVRREVGLPASGMVQQIVHYIYALFPILAPLAPPLLLLILLFRVARPLDFDRILSRLPGYRPVQRAENLAVACRSIAADLQAGLPFPNALRRAGALAQDNRFKRGLVMAGDQTEDGAPLVPTLREHLHPLFGLIPEAQEDWPAVFQTLGRIFELEAQAGFERLRKVLLPAGVLVIGVASGLLVTHFFSVYRFAEWLLGSK